MSNKFVLLRFLNPCEDAPRDQPLFEAVPLEPGFSGPVIDRAVQFTRTGWIWLLLPGYFIWWKQLRWTLLEWLIFVATWGSSSASLLPALIRHNVSVTRIALVMYVLFHVYCIGFALIAYVERQESGVQMMDRAWRSMQIYLLFCFLTIMVHTAVFVMR